MLRAELNRAATEALHRRAGIQGVPVRSLALAAWALALAGRNGAGADDAVFPLNRTEEVLAEVWQEALRLDRVSVEDDFFRLGGDSIRAIQVQVAAGSRGLEIQLRDIFGCATIRELAEPEGTVLTETAPAQ